MQDNKLTREPRQKRSMEKKQLILDTARALFCENGYHSTTTNEIAKEAGVSIGTLYAYFADKETILLELLGQYNAYFMSAFARIDTPENAALFQSDLRAWMRSLIEHLIAVHQPQIAFHRELEMLCYANDAVARVMETQAERVRLATLEMMRSYRARYAEHIVCGDLEAASVIAVDFINTLVDRVVFKTCAVEKERIIAAGAETLYRMFASR